MSNLFSMLDDLNPDEPESKSRDQDILRAPFGYPGGKDKSIKEILPLLPTRDIFIDHCGGSGIITMNRQPSKVLDVYNDRWSGVVAFFQCLRSEEKYLKLRDAINLSLHSREDFVYAKENWDNPKLDDVERACLFHNMLNQSFGKLGRNWARALNSKVAFTRSFEIDYWREIHNRFKKVQIENLDLMQCLNDYDNPLAVHYIDTPYLGTDTGIYKHKFPVSKHEEYLSWIFEHGQGYFAVSHYRNPLYDNFPWDDVHVWPVKVTIDSQSSSSGGNREYDGRGRRETYECLYIKEAK